MALTTEKRAGHRLPALPKKPTASVPRSSTERLWLVGGGTVALLLTVIAYFFFISPQRSETSDVHGQIATAGTKNTVLEHRLAQLRDENRNLSRYQAERDAAREALPSDTDVSDFLRSLQLLGAQTGTNVTSVTVGAPAAATPAPLPGATTSTTPAAPSASASANATAAPGGANAAPSSGVYGLAINAQVSGSPANLTRFLDQLQNVQPRAVLVTAVSETTGGGAAAGNGAAASASGSTSLALTMTAFVAPNAVAPSPEPSK